MKILVLGAGGMAGHVVALHLVENGFAVDTLSAKNALDQNTYLMDVTDVKKFTHFLDNHKYDAVVNCIALLVKQSEEHKALAVYLNAYLPHFLEDYYKDSETKVVHIGTDGVFSGDNPPYHENSKYDGQSFYGRTKALGEIINTKDITFRLSITGPATTKDGAGLFNWFYFQQGEVPGYTNVSWSGITTIELAKAIQAALDQNLAGLYHLAPKDTISKFNLLQLFKEVFDRKDVRLKPVEGEAVGTTLTSVKKDFRYQVPDYTTMIHDMKVWIEKHPKLYKHYER